MPPETRFDQQFAEVVEAADAYFDIVNYYRDPPGAPGSPAFLAWQRLQAALHPVDTPDRGNHVR